MGADGGLGEFVKRFFENSTWYEMLIVRVLLWGIFGVGIYVILRRLLKEVQ